MTLQPVISFLAAANPCYLGDLGMVAAGNDSGRNRQTIPTFSKVLKRKALDMTKTSNHRNEFVEDMNKHAGLVADGLVNTELHLQNKMWGINNERTPIDDRQLMHAAMAQLYALNRKQNGVKDAFDVPPYIYPPNWSGFRGYGSDIANLVVATAFLLQEIKRKLVAGEDYIRSSRPLTKSYTGDAQPHESAASARFEMLGKATPFGNIGPVTRPPSSNADWVVTSPPQPQMTPVQYNKPRLKPAKYGPGEHEHDESTD